MKYLILSSIIIFCLSLNKYVAITDIEYKTEILCSGKIITSSLTYECIDSLELLGKCYGYVNCSACINCNYCKYCNNGGGCGVCTIYSKKSTKVKPIYKAKPPKKASTNSPKPKESNSIQNEKKSTSTKDLLNNSSEKKYDYISKQAVNLRNLPTLNSKIISTLNQNDKIEILGKSLYKQHIKGYGQHYWLKVRYGNLFGWIFQPLISLNSIDIGAIKIIELQRKKVNGKSVNVRSKPTTDSDVLFQLKNNDPIEILKRSNHEQTISNYGKYYWYLINYQGREGWIFGSLIK